MLHDVPLTSIGGSFSWDTCGLIPDSFAKVIIVNDAINACYDEDGILLLPLLDFLLTPRLNSSSTGPRSTSAFIFGSLSDESMRISPQK